MNRISPYFAFLFVTVLTIFGCVQPPDFPDEPVIEFVSISKTTMLQGELKDSFVVTINFTDGDGDIGEMSSDDSAVTTNAFWIDSRTDSIGQEFKLPFVPEQGAGNGISGSIWFTIGAPCCIFDDGSVPCKTSANQATDELTYSLYIVDRAGHKSNTIDIGPITLLCE